VLSEVGLDGGVPIAGGRSLEVPAEMPGASADEVGGTEDSAKVVEAGSGSAGLLEQAISSRGAVSNNAAKVRD